MGRGHVPFIMKIILILYIYKKKWPSLTKEEGGARLKIALEELQLAKLQPANTKI